MHQTKESGSVQSRALKGVCASAQQLGAWRGSRRARPLLPPRRLLATPPAPPPHPALVPHPGHASPAAAQARASGAKVEPRSVAWGRRETAVRPARAPGPRQAQTVPYLRPRPARLPALTARPAPETGSGRRQTPRKALELLPQPDPVAWDSAPSIRLRARSPSPTSRAWAAPSLTPRRPAGRAGPARSALRGRGKVSPPPLNPLPEQQKSVLVSGSSPGSSEGVQTLATYWACSQLESAGVWATHPHPDSKGGTTTTWVQFSLLMCLCRLPSCDCCSTHAQL